MTRSGLSTKILGGVAATAIIATTIGSSASAETLAYPAENFDRIDLSAGLKVIYETADTYSVTADFERGGPDDVVVDVKGSTLVIKRRNQTMNWGRNKVNATFTVTSPELDAVEASSGSSFRGTGINSEDFDVEASSGASIYLEGRCDAVSAEASSGASIKAEGLSCSDGEFEASSGASVRMALTGTMDAEASSGASIRISGNPQVGRLDRSSGASIKVEPGPL
ncbi:MAG: DUF2807 domain-containing protein [Pseudomonadota bacterium]